jgi:hypothetical protein
MDSHLGLESHIEIIRDKEEPPRAREDPSQ